MPTRPCWVEIDTRALEDNYRLLRTLAGQETECLAIVKADAYGHGLTICGPAAVRAGAQWLGVTSVEEAVALRAVCPTQRILVIGGVFPGQAEAVIAHRLTPVVWEPYQLYLLEGAARAAGLVAGNFAVHLEIDTGMSRQGADVDDVAGVLAHFTASSPLRIEAVMTHLYASDEAGARTSAVQLARLEDALKRVSEACSAGSSQPEWLSVGASAALLGGEADLIARLAQRWNLRPMLRMGLALYGVVPRFNPAFSAGEEPAVLVRAHGQLKPVLTWKTRVVSVRTIQPDTEIGYNGTFIATEPMRLALIALGYADGIDRRLGNRFSLLVHGQRVPLVGRISMDQAVLDVTEIEDVAVGQEVVILGAQGGEAISAFEHAEAAATIPWEIFTRIAPRVVRVPV